MKVTKYHGDGPSFVIYIPFQRDCPPKLFKKTVKNLVARQDPRHGGPEESRDAKHAHCLKASTA